MTDEKREAVMDWRHVWTLLVIHGGPPDSLTAKLVAELAERDVEANAFSVEDVDLGKNPDQYIVEY